MPRMDAVGNLDRADRQPDVELGRDRLDDRARDPVHAVHGQGARSGQNINHQYGGAARVGAEADQQRRLGRPGGRLGQAVPVDPPQPRILVVVLPRCRQGDVGVRSRNQYADPLPRQSDGVRRCVRNKVGSGNDHALGGSPSGLIPQYLGQQTQSAAIAATGRDRLDERMHGTAGLALDPAPQPLPAAELPDQQVDQDDDEQCDPDVPEEGAHATATEPCHAAAPAQSPRVSSARICRTALWALDFTVPSGTPSTAATSSPG